MGTLNLGHFKMVSVAKEDDFDLGCDNNGLPVYFQTMSNPQKSGG